MRSRLGMLAALLSLPLLPAAHADGPAQGLTCGLATTADGVRQSGALTGGPVVFTGELATGVDYTCSVLVSGPSGVRGFKVRFSLGPVGLVPPTRISFDADPAVDVVEVCTSIDWVFGWPGGGSVNAGCHTATSEAVPTPGFRLVPTPLS